MRTYTDTNGKGQTYMTYTRTDHTYTNHIHITHKDHIYRSYMHIIHVSKHTVVAHIHTHTYMHTHHTDHAHIHRHSSDMILQPKNLYSNHEGDCQRDCDSMCMAQSVTSTTSKHQNFFTCYQRYPQRIPTGFSRPPRIGPGSPQSNVQRGCLAQDANYSIVYIAQTLIPQSNLCMCRQSCQLA